MPEHCCASQNSTWLQGNVDWGQTGLLQIGQTVYDVAAPWAHTHAHQQNLAINTPEWDHCFLTALHVGRQEKLWYISFRVAVSYASFMAWGIQTHQCALVAFASGSQLKRVQEGLLGGLEGAALLAEWIVALA